MRKYNKNQIYSILDKTNLFTKLETINHNIPPRQNGEVIIFTGEIKIQNIKIQLRIEFDEYFPLHKPNYFITNYYDLEFLAHVASNGNVCYMKEEGVFIDITKTKDVITESLYETIRTIKDGINKLNIDELVNEFETYIFSNKHSLTKIGISNFTITDTVKTIEILVNNKIILIGDTTSNITNLLGLSDVFIHKNHYQKQKAIFIPIDKEHNILPPNYNEYWGREKINELIFNNINHTKKINIENSLLNQKDITTFILSIPLPNGAKSLVGIKFQEIRNSKFHPLIHPNNYCKVKLINIIRQDKEYLIPRGGAKVNLSDKKVAIIGCGSVGGYLASEIIKAGFLNLTLIDNDNLKPENYYRHFLGQKYNSQKKTDALKTEIESNLPYCKIESIPKKIEEVISDKNINFEEFDIVLVATGNPTINFYLNDYFYSKHCNIPVIYAWNDPYGIGGHTLLTNNNKKGCYKCLYPEMNNLASFAQPNQIFSKAISGCGSTYTPYGSTDSLRTVINTVKLAVDIITKKETGNPIISWKGDSTDFTENGFRLSKRYKQTSEKLDDLKYDYINDDCPICSKNN